MAVVLVDVIFFVLLVLGMLRLTICTRALDRCFYSFHTIPNNILYSWEASKKYCQQNDGKLVSMETEEEYQFINKTIQSLDVGDNEWHIGLKKSQGGDWKWISGQSYTIRKDQWAKSQPYGEGDCVKMIKDYGGLGLFDDIKCTKNDMEKFICEFKNGPEKMNNGNGILVYNHTCFDINNAKKGYFSSVRPTSYVKNTMNTTTRDQGKGVASEHFVQHTTSLRVYTSTASSATKTSRKEQKFPIMIVVIVLAVLLAVCICAFVGVFCWFRRKSGKELKKTKSSRNPSKRKSASRSVAQDESDLRNANSGDVQIVNEDTVRYIAPVDDIDYPRTTTNTGARDTDLSTYAEVHDAIQPSAKLTSKYYDDEDLYLNPVNIPPTSDAQFYASVDLDSKPLHDVESKYEKENPELKNAIAEPASCSSMDATSEPSSSLYYATTDLSKPNEAIFETSKQGEEQRCKDVTTDSVSCSSLYATTDLGSIVYEDDLDRTQRLNEASTPPSFYNNLYESTEFIHLQNKATNDGLEQDGKVYIKEEKPRDCQAEASNGAKRKSRHPSIGSIMSASRKSKDTPSIPTPHKEATDDTMMYAMVDLLNNDKEVRPVYAQVNKKHKK